MGNLTANVQTDDALAYLEAVVAESTINSLGMMLGQKVTAEKLPDTGITAPMTWFRQNFSPDQFGFIDFGIESKPAIALGQKILSASGLNGEDDEAAIGSITEILTQVGSSAASSIALRLKHEVNATGLRATQPSGLPAVGIKLIFNDDKNVSLLVCPSSSLCATISNFTNETRALVPSQSIAANPRNIDLLVDVKVPVSVSFGRIRLPLKDVVKLTSGSIVDLHRAVSEPVDIILNDSVIARGEVVVIEGIFGVRIKQIISKQERIHSVS